MLIGGSQRGGEGVLVTWTEWAGKFREPERDSSGVGLPGLGRAGLGWAGSGPGRGRAGAGPGREKGSLGEELRGARWIAKS